MRADSWPAAPLAIEAKGSPERGMRWLLVSLIVLIVVTDILDVPMGLGPGLSGKNALLYVIATALVFKLIVQQSFTFDLRALHVCFVVLIAYSILSMLAAAIVVQYPRYNLIASGISLKSRLLDHAIFFLVFFYGLRESRNANALLKILLLAVVIANTAAVFNSLGIVAIGDMENREDGRMTGVMGESNQDAAFVSLFLPGLAAAMMMSRGVWRAAWFAGLLISLGAIIMTASRGGFAAVVASVIWGALFFRRYVPLRRFAFMAGASLGLIMLVVSVMSIRYGQLLYKRVIGDSTSSDMVGASSGRLEIWANAITTMVDTPLTLLTGFGWNVYWSMPFRLSPHNHYLSLWFNLGLVGLVCGVMLLVLVIREAVAAVRFARPEYQSVLISFSIGTVAIAIATFFVDLYTPWLWFWAYAGLVMRIAVNARAQASKPTVQTAQKSQSLPGRDAFGWVGAARQ